MPRLAQEEERTAATQTCIAPHWHGRPQGVARKSGLYSYLEQSPAVTLLGSLWAKGMVGMK